MARKAMDIIPQDLISLKRPALQKLCKQLGLKANGKNKEMVRLLEEFRDSLEGASEHSNGEQSRAVLESQAEECGTDRDGEGVKDGPACEVGSSEEERGEGEMEHPGEDEGTKREGGRRGRGGKQKRRRPLRGKARKKVSVEKDSSTEESEEVTLSLSGPEKENFPVSSPTDPQNMVPANSNDPLENFHANDPQDSPPVNPPTDLQNIVPVNSNDPLENFHATDPRDSPPVNPPPTDLQCVSPITSISEGVTESLDPLRSSGHRKRRRDTHSVSPTPPSSGSTTAQVTGEELPDAKKQRTELEQVSGAVGSSDTEYLSPLACGTEDLPPKRERRNTYSVSPRGQSSTVTPLPLTPLDTEGTTTPMSGSRKRRRTHSVSPGSSFLVSSAVSVDTDAMETISVATEEAVEDSNVQASSATDEMMALLDKRVAERKADPNYVSPPSVVSDGIIAGSRIPVSKTRAKFDKAHDKHFEKLQSIVEYREQKNKRAQAICTPGPPAKKQKVNFKSSSTPKPTATNSQTASTKKLSTLSNTATKKGGPTIVRPVIPNSSSATTMKPKSTSVVHFDPKLSTNAANFNFGGKTAKTPTAKSASTTSKTAKTPSKSPFKFSAQPGDSPTVHRKWSPKDRRSQFKTHKGKLPDFKFSIY